MADEAMAEACEAAVDAWIDNAPLLVGRNIGIEERIRRSANAAVKQYLTSQPGITCLLELVGLPEWNIGGSMPDWIDCVSDAVRMIGLPVPKIGICPNCSEFRPDRISDDGYWDDQAFSSPCPECGAA